MNRLKKLVPRSLVLAYHWVKAVIAVLWHGYPARDMVVIGVTGTDGKTTTSHLIYSILVRAGLPTSLITTTGTAIHGSDRVPLGLHVTTPSPFELQNFLREARRAGSKYVVLEATSHGLAQHRVLGSNFRIGVVTNITAEHLDYHGDYDQLLRDKARLLRSVKTSVLNRDDASFEALLPLAGGKVLTYGLQPGADLSAQQIEARAEGTSFTLPGIAPRIHTGLIGSYNVENMLAAAAAALALGIDADAIVAGLEATRPPPGRLQRIETGQDFTVFVDFAHTSNSLETMLRMVRKLAQKKLIVVFGCAGERDPGKRFPMGASAGRYCDYTVITAEDPRQEDLQAIMKEIARGCESAGGLRDQSYFCIPDRQQAINFAIRRLAQTGDVVVTTGKAHEQSMCFGSVEYPWDEFRAVQHALGVDGIEPVWLPTAEKQIA